MPALLRRDEAERVRPEARLELPAAVVGLGCHLEHGAAGAEPRADRKIRRSEIEVEEEIEPPRVLRRLV